MGLIKDIYSVNFYDRFADSMQLAVPSFNKKKFIQQIFNNDFAGMEWKQRMQHTTTVLHNFLPEDFPAAARLIREIIGQLRKDSFGDDALAFMFFPDYIASYGLAHFKEAVRSFEFITQFISCEFAVRPFILKYNDKMIDEMKKWSLHKNWRVRRLASEGSRPRLPWAMALPELKKDPTSILPILENLKADPSESVRRSVANNLNDIAKDNPDIVIAISARWKGISKETDAVIKHGARTLLKQGHAGALKHYGLSSKNIDITVMDIRTPVVKIGNYLEFSFTVANNNKKKQVIRLEYAVYYQKSKGHLAGKVYKISEKEYAAGGQSTIQRRQSFKIITTRKFHTGLHKLAIIVNGEEKMIGDFKLI